MRFPDDAGCYVAESALRTRLAWRSAWASWAAVLAQGNLLAAWLAWSDGPFLRRLLTHWKIAAGLYLIWLVGFGLATARNGKVPPGIAAIVALGVPLVSLAAQFPLWVARQWFGWRLVREQADPAHQRAAAGDPRSDARHVGGGRGTRAGPGGAIP